VINESQMVVGLVAGKAATGETEVILARYLMALMCKIGLN